MEPELITVAGEAASQGGCVLCTSPDFLRGGFGERTMIICDQCEREFHIGCLAEAGRARLTELPDGAARLPAALLASGSRHAMHLRALQAPELSRDPGLQWVTDASPAGVCMQVLGSARRTATGSPARCAATSAACPCRWMTSTAGRSCAARTARTQLHGPCGLPRWATDCKSGE